MISRSDLYYLSEINDLDAEQARRLEQLAGWHSAPVQLLRHARQGLAVLAAALGGLAAIMWMAANWDSWGRLTQTAMLQSAVVLACLGAAMLSRWRVPLSLLALLLTGAALAHVGQAYQSGADPWELFAWWAALSLPLCLGARSDLGWAAWVLVALTALNLWLYTYTGMFWPSKDVDLGVYLLAWLGATLLALLMNPALGRRIGAGPWAFRLAWTSCVLMVVHSGLGALVLTHRSMLNGLGMVFLAGASWLLSRPRWTDIPALCLAVLAGLALAAAGLAHLLMDTWGLPWIWSMVAVGLCAVLLLAWAVRWVMRVAQIQTRSQGQSA